MCLAWRESHPALSPVSITPLGGEMPPDRSLGGGEAGIGVEAGSGGGRKQLPTDPSLITCQRKVCRSPRLLALWPLAGPTNPWADKAQLLTSCLSMRPFVRQGSEASSGPARGLIKLQCRRGTKGPHTRPERPGSTQDPPAVPQLPRPGWPRGAHGSRLPHITGRGHRSQDPPAGGPGRALDKGAAGRGSAGAAGNQSLPKFPRGPCSLK